MKNQVHRSGLLPGCSDYAALTRRRLLQGGALGAATMALPRAAFARAGGNRDVLVLVFLRGGMDGLTLCAPYADSHYYTHRPTLAVPPPGQANGAVDLDGFFGLAPSAAALLPSFVAGDLAIVHTAGSTDPTRSHFDAMKFIEGGVPNQNAGGISTGWLARHLLSVSPAGTNSVRALALDALLPFSMAGSEAVLSVPDPSSFDFGGWNNTASARRQLLTTLYESAPEPQRSGALATLAMIDVLAAIDFASYAPSGGAVYPATDFGTSLMQTAALIKANIGLEAIEVDYGGWDHHTQMGPLSGQLAGMLGDLTQSLAALRLDLGSTMDRVTVVVHSEFGRRVDQNGSAGTDHGRGTCMLVMGGNVNGGQVYRNWTSLATNQLDNFALPVRIDYRDVLFEVLDRRMGGTDLGFVFPNHTPTALGVVS